MVYFLPTSAFADELWRCGRPRELELPGSVLFRIGDSRAERKPVGDQPASTIA
jgi:hypothetical protein